MNFLKKPKSSYYGKSNNEEIIPLESLPPDIQEKLMALFQNENCSDEEIEIPFFGGQKSDTKSLEERGIILINSPIAKETLALATARLLALHFDDNFTDEVQIIINSPGGYLDACWAFIDVMNNVRMPIRTIAMGEIASAATMIFVAGDERIMAPNSGAMIHHFSGGNFGNYRDLVAGRKMEDIEFKKIVNHFLLHSKYTKAQEVVNNILLDQDHWLTPQEMKKHGLCDTVLPYRKSKKKKKKESKETKKTKKKNKISEEQEK